MIEASVIAAGVITIIALAFFVVKSIVGHILASKIGAAIAKRRRERRQKDEELE